MTTPALIALDWGTSNLRATLLDAHGHVLEHLSAPGGVMKVAPGQFSASLLALCGPWLAEHAVAVIASGMVGSRQGWKEAPYLPCPAKLHEAAHALVRVEIEGAPGSTRHVHIVPGLRCEDARGQADVMRGEETQLWGAGLPPESVCLAGNAQQVGLARRFWRCDVFQDLYDRRVVWLADPAWHLGSPDDLCSGRSPRPRRL